MTETTTREHLEPVQPPPEVQRELNALFDRIQPLAERLNNIAGEFGYSHVHRAKRGCQVLIAGKEFKVEVRSSDPSCVL
jgi:hypothetical protein